MMKEYNLQKEIEELLDKEKTSEPAKASILMNLRNLQKRLAELEERLFWLEEAIDESDSAEIYIEYQKQFSLNHWSGEPD